MNLRKSITAVPAVVTVLSLLAACGGEENPGPANAGGAPGGGTGAASGGHGGGGSGGTLGAAAVGGGAPPAGAAGSGTAIPATFETVKTVINDAPCFGAGCHNDAQNPLNLTVDDQLYMRLTTHVSKNCGNLPIVNPGKPQESAIVKILKGPCTPTPRMPFGCVDDEDAKCIPADYIAAITQWIAAGAPQR